MTVDDIFDALYLQAKDHIGLTELRDIVLTDESINRLQFHGAGQEPIIFIKERHGRWIKRGDNSWECSACREISCCNGNYCVDCGAKMDEVEE